MSPKQLSRTAGQVHDETIHEEDAVQSDLLDQLLTESAPATRFDISKAERLSLVDSARRATRRRRGRVGRAAVAVIAAFAVLSGGTVAAFANEDLRNWFLSGISDPYVTFDYTVPSGALCTETSGDPIADNPDAADALRKWLASADLLTLVDIDSALDQVRSYEEYDQEQVGSDDEYRMAVGIAVVLAARTELESQGFEPGSIDMWKTETDCVVPEG